MTQHEHVDRRYGYVYRYHSRSDAHSVKLCELMLNDLLDACPKLRDHAARRVVVYGINVTYVSPVTGKSKAFDLAIGPPASPVPDPSSIECILKGQLADVYFSCEAKTVMTEHSKSKPRVYDELSSSHEIVHQGKQEAIATGITVVNIADTFVSPLRQTGVGSLVVSTHKQPAAAAGMIQHLRGLPIRDNVGQVGFDAYTTFVLDNDNQGPVSLHTAPPAPQPGDRDEYNTFIKRVCRFYDERF